MTGSFILYLQNVLSAFPMQKRQRNQQAGKYHTLCALQIKCIFWTNPFYNLDKYLLTFGQILFTIWANTWSLLSQQAGIYNTMCGLQSADCMHPLGFIEEEGDKFGSKRYSKHQTRLKTPGLRDSEFLYSPIRCLRQTIWGGCQTFSTPSIQWEALTPNLSERLLC